MFKIISNNWRECGSLCSLKNCEFFNYNKVELRKLRFLYKHILKTSYIRCYYCDSDIKVCNAKLKIVFV